MRRTTFPAASFTLNWGLKRLHSCCTVPTRVPGGAVTSMDWNWKSIIRKIKIKFNLSNSRKNNFTKLNDIFQAVLEKWQIVLKKYTFLPADSRGTSSSDKQAVGAGGWPCSWNCRRFSCRTGGWVRNSFARGIHCSLWLRRPFGPCCSSQKTCFWSQIQ